MTELEKTLEAEVTRLRRVLDAAKAYVHWWDNAETEVYANGEELMLALRKAVDDLP